MKVTEKCVTFQLRGRVYYLVWGCLGTMKILVKSPVMARVDNIGAIFMANNITTTSYTKHMNVTYKYVNEYV